MKFRLSIYLFLMIFISSVYSESEFTETVPPSVLFRYATGEYPTFLLAIGHKPINKKDTFAGFYYEKDEVTDSFLVRSLGIVSFNFSQQETPKSGAELRIGLSETNNGTDIRKGVDVGLELHKYISPSLSIGIGGVMRPDLLSYQSDRDDFLEYKANIGVYYKITDYFKLSGMYRHDGVVLENMSHQSVHKGLQVAISMLF